MPTIKDIGFNGSKWIVIEYEELEIQVSKSPFGDSKIQFGAKNVGVENAEMFRSMLGLAIQTARAWENHAQLSKR